MKERANKKNRPTLPGGSGGLTRDDLRVALAESKAHALGNLPEEVHALHHKMIPDLHDAVIDMREKTQAVHGWVAGKIAKEQQWKERRQRLSEEWASELGKWLIRIVVTAGIVILAGKGGLALLGG